MFNIEEVVNQSILNNDVRQLEEILNNMRLNNFQIDAIIESSSTALHLAVQRRNVEQARLLLRQGASVGLRTRGGDTCLHLAAASGALDLLRLLLSSGADVGETNNSRRTALHVAAKAKHREIVEELLKHGGAELNAQDSYGNTVLHEAVSQKDVDTVKLLLSVGADPNVKNKGGQSAFQQSFQLENDELTNLFLDRGASVVATNNMGRNALHLSIIHHNAFETVKRVMESDVDVNARTSFRETALHLPFKHIRCDNYFDSPARDAALFNKRNDQLLLRVVRLLLKSGADATAVDKSNKTALDYALHYKKLSIARYLLLYGASVERDPGRIPVPRALEIRDAEQVRRTLRDINRHVHSNEGLSVLLGAFAIDDSQMRYSVVRLLLESDGDSVRERYTDGSSVLHWAIRLRDMNLFYLCMTFGADVTAKTEQGHSPLFKAVLCDLYPAAEYLLRKRASADERIDDYPVFGFPHLRGQTSTLAAAVYKRSTRMVRLLLDSGARVNDNLAWQGLAMFGTLEALKVFEARRATYHDQSAATGKWFFKEAVRFYNLEVIRYMLDERAADVNGVYGESTPLEVLMRQTAHLAARSPVVDATENCLVERVALLAAENAPVHERNLAAIDSRAETAAYYKRCGEELARMKVTRVCSDLNVTYYDALARSHGWLVNCLRFERISGAWREKNLKESFEIFCGRLEKNHAKASWRLEKMTRFERVLRQALDDKIPGCIVRLISEYYNDKDFGVCIAG